MKKYLVAGVKDCYIFVGLHKKLNESWKFGPTNQSYIVFTMRGCDFNTIMVDTATPKDPIVSISKAFCVGIKNLIDLKAISRLNSTLRKPNDSEIDQMYTQAGINDYLYNKIVSLEGESYEPPAAPVAHNVTIEEIVRYSYESKISIPILFQQALEAERNYCLVPFDVSTIYQNHIKLIERNIWNPDFLEDLNHLLLNHAEDNYPLEENVWALQDD